MAVPGLQNPFMPGFLPGAYAKMMTVDTVGR